MLRNKTGVFYAYSVSFFVLLTSGWFSLEKKAGPEERHALAQKFKFSRISLDTRSRNWRKGDHLFSKPYQHLEGWLTAFVPTGVALTDLDGRGVTNDVCLTDPFEKRISLHWNLNKKGLESHSIELVPPLLPAKLSSFPSGCLPGDFNEDGEKDLLVYFWGRSPIVFLQKNGTFTPREVLTNRERWYTESVTSGDVDGDGKLDLIVANYFPEEFWVLNEAPTGGKAEMNQGAGNALNGAYNRLLLGKPDSNELFTEVPNAFGDELGGGQWTIAAAAVDVDRDLLPEIFFINDHGPDRLLHNRSTPGRPQFALVEGSRKLFVPKSLSLGKDGFHGMGIDFGDWSQDGYLDFFVSNFTAPYVLHQANFAWIHTGDSKAFREGRAPFESKAEDIGFARSSQVPWDLRLADFNNDGKLEIFQSTGFMRGNVNRTPEMHEAALWNDVVMKYPEVWHRFSLEDELSGKGPNVFFTQMSGGRYVDIGSELAFLEAGVSRGASTGDLDGDGRLDLLVTHHNANPTLYSNQSPASRFLGLDLRLPLQNGKNRSAIGANVIVTLSNGRRVAATVDGGSGFGGKKAPVIHLGLGEGSLNEVFQANVVWLDTNGKKHERAYDLNPGWHTLLLETAVLKAEVGR